METEEARRARAAKAELAEILERRPDLKGKSIEAVRRLLRREARLSLRPQRTSKNQNSSGCAAGARFGLHRVGLPQSGKELLKPPASFERGPHLHDGVPRVQTGY